MKLVLSNRSLPVNLEGLISLAADRNIPYIDWCMEKSEIMETLSLRDGEKHINEIREALNSRGITLHSVSIKSSLNMVEDIVAAKQCTDLLMKQIKMNLQYFTRPCLPAWKKERRAAFWRP